MKLKTLAAALLVPALLAACEPAEEDTSVPADQTQEPRMTGDAGGPAAIPDTTGPAVWAHVQEEDYRSWQLWPDRGELYDGGEPHGMLLTTYLNDIAHEALTASTGPMPPGAVIVKENFMPDSTLAAVTVMVKTDGANPDHNDWFFTKHGPDGAVEAAGKNPPCAACHSSAQRDYLLTANDAAPSGGGR